MNARPAGAVATALRYEGFQVAEASGRAAPDTACRTEPDLVVLDWMLPDIDGLEVTRRLRQHHVNCAILFRTANHAVENRVEALQAGADDHLSKPFSLDEVVVRIHAVLRRSTSGPPDRGED